MLRKTRNQINEIDNNPFQTLSISYPGNAPYVVNNIPSQPYAYNKTIDQQNVLTSFPIAMLDRDNKMVSQLTLVPDNTNYETRNQLPYKVGGGVTNTPSVIISPDGREIPNNFKKEVSPEYGNFVYPTRANNFVKENWKMEDMRLKECIGTKYNTMRNADKHKRDPILITDDNRDDVTTYGDKNYEKNSSNFGIIDTKTSLIKNNVKNNLDEMDIYENKYMDKNEKYFYNTPDAVKMNIETDITKEPLKQKQQKFNNVVNDFNNNLPVYMRNMSRQDILNNISMEYPDTVPPNYFSNQLDPTDEYTQKLIKNNKNSLLNDVYNTYDENTRWQNSEQDKRVRQQSEEQKHTLLHNPELEKERQNKLFEDGINETFEQNNKLNNNYNPDNKNNAMRVCADNVSNKLNNNETFKQRNNYNIKNINDSRRYKKSNDNKTFEQNNKQRSNAIQVNTNNVSNQQQFKKNKMNINQEIEQFATPRPYAGPFMNILKSTYTNEENALNNIEESRQEDSDFYTFGTYEINDNPEATRKDNGLLPEFDEFNVNYDEYINIHPSVDDSRSIPKKVNEIDALKNVSRISANDQITTPIETYNGNKNKNIKFDTTNKNIKRFPKNIENSERFYSMRDNRNNRNIPKEKFLTSHSINNQRKFITNETNRREYFAGATPQDTAENIYISVLESYADMLCNFVMKNKDFQPWRKYWEKMRENLYKCDGLFEVLDTSDADVAYVENKGEEMKFRIRDNDKWIKISVYTYVLTHEMAHLANYAEWGHGEQFQELMHLLEVAAYQLGIIKPEKYPISDYKSDGTTILSRDSIKQELLEGITILIQNGGNEQFYKSLARLIQSY